MDAVVIISEPVWFTLTETEISVNGKLIPLTETKMETKKLRKTETEKFETETDNFGYLGISVFISVAFPFHAITQVLCNVIR